MGRVRRGAQGDSLNGGPARIEAQDPGGGLLAEVAGDRQGVRGAGRVRSLRRAGGGPGGSAAAGPARRDTGARRTDGTAGADAAGPPPEFVLCHSDIHAANLLVAADGALYIVDWDEPILAPKERDLMYAGGGQSFLGYTPQEEEALFYRGYGETQVDPVGLAYYRYERIIEDIAAFCEQLLTSGKGGADPRTVAALAGVEFRAGRDAGDRVRVGPD